MMMRVLPHMTWVKRAFIGLLRTFSGWFAMERRWSLYFTPTNKKFSIAPLIFATAASRSKVVIHLFTVSPITEKTVIFALRSNESLAFVCVLLVFHVVPIALSLRHYTACCEFYVLSHLIEHLKPYLHTVAPFQAVISTAKYCLNVADTSDTWL